MKFENELAGLLERLGAARKDCGIDPYEVIKDVLDGGGSRPEAVAAAVWWTGCTVSYARAVVEVVFSEG